MINGNYPVEKRYPHYNPNAFTPGLFSSTAIIIYETGYVL